MVRAARGRIERRSDGAGAGMTRDELAHAIDAAMEASNAAVERTIQAGLDDSHELAVADAALVRLYVQSLALHAGPAFQRVLCRASMGAEPGEPCPEHGPDTGRAIALLLARLVHDFAPVIGPALPQLVIEDASKGDPDCAVLALVRELKEMGTEDGASLQLLPEPKGAVLPAPKRRRGIGDHRDIKRAARRRLVPIVYYEAGRAGETLKRTRERLGLFLIEERTWERMVKAVPEHERIKARADGVASTVPHPDLVHVAELQKLALR